MCVRVRGCLEALTNPLPNVMKNEKSHANGWSARRVTSNVFAWFFRTGRGPKYGMLPKITAAAAARKKTKVSHQKQSTGSKSQWAHYFHDGQQGKTM